MYLEYYFKGLSVLDKSLAIGTLDDLREVNILFLWRSDRAKFVLLLLRPLTRGREGAKIPWIAKERICDGKGTKVISLLHHRIFVLWLRLFAPRVQVE